MSAKVLLAALASGLFAMSPLSLIGGCGGASTQGSGGPPSDAGGGPNRDSGVRRGDAGGSSDAKSAPDGTHGDSGTQGPTDGAGARDGQSADSESTKTSDATDDAHDSGHSEGGEPSDASGAHDGQAGDGASAVTVDAGGDAQANAAAFDTNLCTGPAMTVAEAASHFASGATTAVLAPYTLYLRQRSCNMITGCTAWSPATANYETLDQFGNPQIVSAPPSQDSGDLELLVSGTTVTLSLRSTGPFGAFVAAMCGTVTAPVTCGEYEIQTSYTELLQGGGSAQEPTEDPLLLGSQFVGDTVMGGSTSLSQERSRIIARSSASRILPGSTRRRSIRRTRAAHRSSPGTTPRRCRAKPTTRSILPDGTTAPRSITCALSPLGQAIRFPRDDTDGTMGGVRGS